MYIGGRVLLPKKSQTFHESREDVIKIADKIKLVRDETMKDTKEIRALYSHAKSEDVRLSTLNRLFITLNSVYFSLAFLIEDLLCEEWWKEKSQTTIDSKDNLITILEYEQFIKIGFLQLMFSGLESSFRRFLRAIDPNAGGGSTAAFQNIYQALFKRLDGDFSRWEPLLDLFRMVRNTVHNNGIYIDKQGKDQSVDWDGVTYNFEHENPVNFVSWELLIAIADSVRGLIRAVVEDHKLTAISVDIVDPAMNT